MAGAHKNKNERKYRKKNGAEYLLAVELH